MSSVADELDPARARGAAGADARWVRRMVWVGAIGTAVAFFMHAALRYFTFTEASYRSFWQNRHWLLMHVIGGTIALFCGLPQFAARLRERYRSLHRWPGRAYLLGVMFGVTRALYLSFHSVLGWTVGVATFFLGLAWVVTSGMAYLAVRRRQFAAHREWMIRSYVVTFAFVFFRVLLESPLFAHAGTKVERVTALLWISFMLPPLVTEVVLQWRRTLGIRGGVGHGDARSR